VASWSEIEREAPELAAAARGFLDARKHLTLATLRRDGSPRISGTEVRFMDGNVWLGSMWEAVKALDLLRDSRFALHSGSDDPPDWKGDAKLSGRAREVDDEERKARIRSEGDDPESEALGRFHLFRLDIEELSVVRLGEPADHLVIESWHPGRGVTRLTRD
jgi:hypothetical protein